MRTNKKRVVKLLIILVALMVLASGGEGLGVTSAFAQAATPPASPSVGETIKELLKFVEMFTSFMHVLLLISLQMVGYLLSSDFFNDPDMVLMLRRIWVLSRDLMNLAFSIALIGVALYTIVMAKGDFVKDKIVTFFTAVILVNFSWFFPRVIIDVANVLTATVYSIPNMLPSFDCKALNDAGQPEACKIVTDIVIFPTPEERQQPQFRPENGGQCLAELTCFRLQDYNIAAPTMSAANAMINGMAVSFARIATLAKVPTQIATAQLNANENELLVSLKLMVSIIMTLFIQVALVFPLLGLAVGLLIRIIVLWVTIAFMPFAFLGYVVNGKLGTDVFGLSDYIWKNFLGAAFLPVTVAIPFVIGFIMLSSVSTMPMPVGVGLNQVWNYPLVSGISSWWSFLWMVAALMIIWKGAFEALGKFEAAKGITDKIKGYGQMLGSAAAQLPLLAPIPLPGGKSLPPMSAVLSKPRILAEQINLASRSGGSLKDVLDGVRGGGRREKEATEKAAKGFEGDLKGSNNIVKAIEELKKATSDKDRGAQLQVIRDELKKQNVIVADDRQILPQLKLIVEQQRRNGKGRFAESDFSKSLEDAEKAVNAPPPQPAPPQNR